MNRLLRGLLEYIGDVSPSSLRLNEKDLDRIELILAQIKDNKAHNRIVNNGIDDKDIEMFGKYIIPFDAVSKLFIKEQVSRGNAVATLKHYEQSIRRTSQFLCWFDDTDNCYQMMNDAQRISNTTWKISALHLFMMR